MRLRISYPAAVTAAMVLVCTACLLLCMSCHRSAPGNADPKDASADADPAGWEDDDQDTISNGEEGFQEGEQGRDTDNDLIPDYLDIDSDHDGIPDRVEAGDDDLSTPPRDTDADGVPDYLDTDSDNDGVLDSCEDRDGNGMAGECNVPCDPGTGAGCGPGQYCLPSREVCADNDCLQSETDPLWPDTDGDGVPDEQEPGGICCTYPGDHPHGRPQTCTVRILPFTQLFLAGQACGSPHLNLDVTEDSITAGAFGYTDPGHQAGGLFLGRPASGQTGAEESLAAIQSLQGISTLSATLLDPGYQVRYQGYSHDSVQAGAVVELHTANPVDLGQIRNEILMVLTGLSPSDFATLPPELGVTAQSFVMTLTAATHPATNCGPARTVFLSAIARLDDYVSGQPARIHLDNVGDGMAVAAYERLFIAPECDFYWAAADGQSVFVELRYDPIAASLAVAVSGPGGQGPAQFIQPGFVSGFYYEHQTGRILLAGHTPDQLPLEVVVAFQRWYDDLIPPDCYPTN